MIRISADETRHAALAWDVMRWASARLAPAARRRVDDALLCEVAELTRSVEAPVPSEWSEVGHPTTLEARALLASLRASLWQASDGTLSRG